VLHNMLLSPGIKTQQKKDSGPRMEPGWPSAWQSPHPTCSSWDKVVVADIVVVAQKYTQQSTAYVVVVGTR
jgi:hypothetical protein